MIDTERWIKRANDVVTHCSLSEVSEQMQFATSMIATFYGPESAQMKTFRDTAEAIHKGKEAVQHHLQLHARATIENVKAELEAGLVKNVRGLIAGEMIGELLALAKEILSDDSESAKNVGAVLVAAGFEDLMRRLGTEFAGIGGRPDLKDILTTLKEKDVLKGGEPATAQGYLKFRNDSLHADWSKVERSQVHSCLSFTEQLLLKHFS